MRRVGQLMSAFGPLGLVVVLSKVHAAYIADPPYDYTGTGRFGWSLLFAFVLGVAAYGMGLPDVPQRMKQAVGSALVASLLGAVFVSIVQLAFGDALLPRFVVGGAAIASVPLHLVAWWLSRRGRQVAKQRDRVTVVSSTNLGAEIEADLKARVERPATVVAAISTEDVRASGRSEQQPLVALVEREGCGVLVLDRTALDEESIVHQAAILHERGVRVRSVLQFYSEWLGKLPASELERSTLFFDIAELHRRQYARLKRLFDLIGALAGLFVMVLLLPLVLLGNAIGNRGPLVYRQERVGRDGRVFTILKYRTMSAAPGSTTEWTAEDDPRVTRFGRVLRRTHLDELPQVLNVLRGDLSLVGPRPEQPRYVEEFTEKLPYYPLRHLVRPGLTGWAQVNLGYVGDEQGSLEKLQYEFYYLQHQSLLLDLRILGRTIRHLGALEGGR